MQQEIPPVHNPIFPTADSLRDVITEAVFALEDGVISTNQLCQLFGTYHNTLLKKLADQQSAP